MNSEKIHIENQSLGKIIYLKLKDIMLLTKFRLSSLVVFSAVMSYLIAVHSIHIDGIKIILLALGGFLVTASSNTFNQIIEKDTDRLMAVSYTHLRAHETDSYLVCRLLLE